LAVRKPIEIGSKFFRLTVIGEAPWRKRSSGYPIYSVYARCDCGNLIVVPEYKLRAKHTKSCGCLQQEKAILNLPPPKHQKTRTAEYNSWQSMKQRCYYKNCSAYKNYGARGILVCERWLNSFDNFLLDMGLRPAEGFTLERRDTNKHYDPDNCYWADWYEQAQNRRNNRNVVVNETVMCVSQAVKVIGTHESKIIRMVKKLGITHQKAIDLLMMNPRPVNMRQFKQILNGE